ncbi:GrpB family protein [Antrihabitans sp. NCIMB 15449]|uniref:GrpB family protein n=1 Tax=Antrihabitans spumae TaxID=3373370 RepID=A0ABW7JJ06_9NOCA
MNKGREQFGNPPGIHGLHLYVVVAGSLPHRDHVDLRDYLRGNAADAKHYGDLKARLAPWLSVDRERYFEGKRPFIDELLERARLSKT